MKVVIIGNGIAGSSAARYIRKYSDHEIIMISNESEYPFSRTALMYIYMGHQRLDDTKLYEDEFWDKNRIGRLKSTVLAIHQDSKTLTLSDGKIVSYDKLIIATGSKSNKFGWPGQEFNGVIGLYNLQDLELIESHSKNIKKAVIVGGGLIGIELAEMLHSRNIQVTFLLRESSYWNIILPLEESMMINREVHDNGIHLRLSEELNKVIDDGSGNVKGVITSKGTFIEAQFVGLTVGVSPNIDFIQTNPIETLNGVLVDEYLATSEPDIYAIGDCAQLRNPIPGRKPIEALWYTGRMMGQTVAHTICKSPVKYNPGIWFNSAKFFNIEYQVYGEIQAKRLNHIHTLFWMHPNHKKAIRINFHAYYKNVTGFNLMGIRYRHEVCEKWIQSKTSIEEVLPNLSLANFDPEFFNEYESKLIEQYNQVNGSSLRLKSKRSLDLVTRFLNKVKPAK
ncbi:MAG: FAD/NAD(P)-binding oxidoreductase [Saprospiraceae bacterium]|nr:FAD/NAD(P)-binding oxidoreductase [Saprospiraceae bacterium]